MRSDVGREQQLSANAAIPTAATHAPGPTGPAPSLCRETATEATANSDLPQAILPYAQGFRSAIGEVTGLVLANGSRNHPCGRAAVHFRGTADTVLRLSGTARKGNYRH